MSTTLRRTISVPGVAERVFGYIADFSNAAEWDPGVVEAHAVGAGPPRPGSEFELTVDFKGRKLVTSYEITELEAPHRVVFVGGTRVFRSTDEITVTPTDGRLRIDYVALFELFGVFSLAEPLLRRSFSRLADDAVAGLEETLRRMDGGE